jgi:two-component system, chemotaxis family, CheB/CheR fusion protein
LGNSQLASAQHVAPVRIVVIEDDDAMREMVATALRLKGYQVRTAGDGLAGLRLLDAYEPDLVVLDLNLPIVSGLDVVNELRAIAKTRRTPLIAISGQDQQLRLAKDTNEFMATIAKPFDPQTLVRAVDRVTKQPGL